MANRIIVRRLLVTDLSQQIKKQRDFLKWMARRYFNMNPEQSAAFTKGAELFEELRQEILQGLFDEVDPAGRKELFTKSSAAAAAALEPAELNNLEDEMKA